jgi:hypothetical protein
VIVETGGAAVCCIVSKPFLSRFLLQSKNFYISKKAQPQFISMTIMVVV